MKWHGSPDPWDAIRNLGQETHVTVDLELYRRSDRSIIKAFTARIPFKSSPFNKDKNVGEFTGGRASFEIQRALKSGPGMPSGLAKHPCSPRTFTCETDNNPRRSRCLS